MVAGQQARALDAFQPVLRAVARGDVDRVAQDHGQVRAALEHLLVAFRTQSRGGEGRRLGQAGAVPEHLRIAGGAQGRGGHFQRGNRGQVRIAVEEALESLVRHTGLRPVVFARHQAHDVARRGEIDRRAEGALAGHRHGRRVLEADVVADGQLDRRTRRVFIPLAPVQGIEHIGSGIRHRAGRHDLETELVPGQKPPVGGDAAGAALVGGHLRVPVELAVGGHVGHPGFKTVAGRDIRGHHGDLAQVRAVVEHVLVAGSDQRLRRQGGRFRQGDTAVEHLFVAVRRERTGRQDGRLLQRGATLEHVSIAVLRERGGSQLLRRLFQIRAAIEETLESLRRHGIHRNLQLGSAQQALFILEQAGESPARGQGGQVGALRKVFADDQRGQVAAQVEAARTFELGELVCVGPVGDGCRGGTGPDVQFLPFFQRDEVFRRIIDPAVVVDLVLQAGLVDRHRAAIRVGRLHIEVRQLRQAAVREGGLGLVEEFVGHPDGRGAHGPGRHEIAAEDPVVQLVVEDGLDRRRSLVIVPGKRPGKVEGLLPFSFTVVGDAHARNDRQVGAHLGHQGQVLRLDDEVQREHRFEQAVRKRDVQGLLLSDAALDRRMRTLDIHILQGKQGDLNVAIEGLGNIGLVIMARHTQDLRTDLLVVGRRRRESDGPPSFFRAFPRGGGTDAARRDDGIGRIVFHGQRFDRHRAEVHDRIGRGEVVEELGVQDLVVHLLAGETLGHPGLHHQARDAVGNIAQVAGDHVARDVGATRGLGRRIGRQVADGFDLLDIDPVPEIPENGIVAVLVGQVDAVEVVFSVLGKGAVGDDEGRFELARRDGSLIEIAGAQAVVVRHHAVRAVLEILHRGNRMDEVRIARQVGGIALPLQAGEGERVVALHEYQGVLSMGALHPVHRGVGAFVRHVDHGEALGREPGARIGNDGDLRPVAD